MSGLDYERVVLAGGALGISRAALMLPCPTFMSGSNSAGRLENFS